MADAKNAYLSIDKQKSFIILITFEFLLIMTKCRINFAHKITIKVFRQYFLIYFLNIV